MFHANMRVEWAAAITLHLDLDVVDTDGFQLRGSGHKAVQLLVGSAVRVHVWHPDAAAPVLARPGSIVDSVIAVEVADARLAPENLDTNAALSGNQSDDTILSPGGLRASNGLPPVTHTHRGNDVDDTILGRPAGGNELADTIIGGGSRPIAPEAAGAVARHAVRFPDGRVVPLDRIVYVGRSPRSPRITSGAAPELVAVPSPLREISGTHLEIEVQGGVVVVRDLGSTNGTYVSMPGAMRSLLSPGDSRVVLPGTLLDLGDSTVLEIVPGSIGGPAW